MDSEDRCREAKSDRGQKTGIEGLDPDESKEGRVTERETEKLEVVVRMKCLEFVSSEVA